jgi:hypothetical protein
MALISADWLLMSTIGTVIHQSPAIRGGARGGFTVSSVIAQTIASARSGLAPRSTAATTAQ